MLRRHVAWAKARSAFQYRGAATERPPPATGTTEKPMMPLVRLLATTPTADYAAGTAGERADDAEEYSSGVPKASSPVIKPLGLGS